MNVVYVDIETRSRVDLKNAGTYRYVECPDWEILMGAWSLNDGPVFMTIGHEATVAQFEAYQMIADRFIAHSCQFERINFSRAALPSCTYLPPEPWLDTAAIAAELGFPRKLAPLAVALGGEQKDEAGTRLINLFCKPRTAGKMKGTFWSPAEKPDEWMEFISYCHQDVVTLRDVYKRLGGWPSETERQAFMADQRMNDNGITIDVDLAIEAVRCAAENAKGQMLELSDRTDWTVLNPNSQPQMMAWVRAQGLPATNLKAATVEALLASALTDDQRAVLELRQELALVASKKFQAAIRGVSSDGRLRGQFQFYGAHTGRWSGRGVQLQNLPRASLPSTMHVDEAIVTLKTGENVDAQTLKALIRPMLVGPFTTVDYSAIEARVIAWLAGEQWALDAFAGGRDIYVETAERMSTSSKKLTRQQGKVAVLALGYAGGVNALKVMGGQGTKDELQLLVNQWRRANPKIVRFWAALDEALGEGGQVGKVRVTHSQDRRGTIMHVRLPSGRTLNYHGMKWMRYRVTDKVTGKTTVKEGWTYLDPTGTGRIGTYGGRMSENITQAVARDVLAEAMIKVEEAGLVMAGTVHDEFLIEGAHPVKQIERLICTMPRWADGLPLSAEGGVLMRYSK